jgi:Transposase DDE domain group 1
LRVQRDGRPVTVTVTADGDDQTVNHAGAALLAEAADRLGLTRALSDGLAGLRQRRSGHDPGRVVRDLAVMLADGGDALCDLRALRDQPALFGAVASDATAWRVIDAVCEHGLLDVLRQARAVARERAFGLGARPAGLLEIDVDATLVTAHSDKDGATGTYKGGFGFHPLLAYLDTPDLPAGGMALAGRLRPGNAGANTASDHTGVVADALEQLPREVVENADILVRCDSAGATHELLDFCRDGALRFSVGFDLTEAVRRAILALPEQAWTAALDQDGTPRDNGQVAEITDQLDLSGWPQRSRVIVRRERPHPGAQLSFSDHDGHRFQAVLTDHPETDIAALERRHRARARVEDRIRAAKDCGLTNLPFRDFDANAVWLELVLIAQDLVFYTQTLGLDGELARCEPKRLRYRLLHCAGRLAFHARQAVLRLPRSWPWAGELAAAFARLAAVPAR